MGGDVVSSVPADVRLEWRVRSSSHNAVVKNNLIVDRCFKAGALAVGASVKIANIPGYLPMRSDLVLQDLFLGNASELVGRERVTVMED
jgi:metal-dependent amidase/aminoacylase/carboxypeptidase family protein